MGSDFGALGFLVGKEVEDGVPYSAFRSPPAKDELKALGAAMAPAASGPLLCRGNNAPPPQTTTNDWTGETISIQREEIDEVYSKNKGYDADIVALGCPHCSAEELEKISNHLAGRKVKKEMWVYTARKIRDACPSLVERIESSGARVFCDTCMVVSPATERFGKMMVNSGKALVYLPGLGGINAAFGSLEECIDVALGRTE